MRIAVTGASGFVGRQIVEDLHAHGYTVFPVKLREDPVSPLCAAIVHLAGENVAQRWTPEAKREIRRSRVDGTNRVVGAIAGMNAPPVVLVSASAVGIYGNRGDQFLTERSAPASGFLG